jgi:hypothetical protein
MTLLGLPDIAHAGITSFCGLSGHLDLMSMSVVARRVFGSCITAVKLTHSPSTGAAVTLVGLLRKLPNLRQLDWDHSYRFIRDDQNPTLGVLAHAIAVGGCCQRLVRLELYSHSEQEDLLPFTEAIRTGNLPSLEVFKCSNAPVGLLLALSEGLRQSASPRLRDVQCVCTGRGLAAFAETLEARLEHGCTSLVRLSLMIGDEVDGEEMDGRHGPDGVRRALSSRALRDLEVLEVDSEVGLPLPCESLY